MGGTPVAIDEFMVEFARRDILYQNKLIHKTWRGHNREWIFKGEEEKHFYLKFLNMSLSKEACDFQALCLMSNHTHEIYNVHDIQQFCSFLRKHHTLFGIYYNRKNQRTGPVSEARPKTKPITSDIQDMICNFYVHTNPLKSKIVTSLDELKTYPHSTYPFYAHGIFKDWMKSVIFPQWYLKLGTTADEQRRYYVYLLNEYLHIPEEKFIQSLSL